MEGFVLSHLREIPGSSKALGNRNAALEGGKTHRGEEARKLFQWRISS